ncbi:uncharacterized protein LOC117179874 [Belonocnema kinseyi]|uniref:uncharacterized protein LOC117179874 n=1 Tax=Belonocnema kinseyi TaxID=2817044 RepID=UPI00143DC431|nr:uncharacterized protein LOC117179874 [Belonocnema kinseyi]
MCHNSRSKEEMISRMQRKLGLEQDIERELHLMGTAPDVGANFLTNKTNSQLRKRGEEWRDKVFVDDSPEDGPNLYVVLTGFYDPNLPLDLIDAGVPLNCILRIKRPLEDFELYDFEDSKADYNKNRLFVSVKKSDLIRFWIDLENQWKDPKRSEDFCKLIFLTFCPPKINILEKGQNLMKEIYDRICFIIYDLYELCHQHVKYLRAMKLQKVAEERPIRQDISSYESVMADIPEESATVFIVLNALITQIEANLNPSSDYDTNFFESPSFDMKKSREPLNSGHKFLYNLIKNLHTPLFSGNPKTDVSLIPLSFMETLVALNLKHETIKVTHPDYNQSSQVSNLKLVLYRDTHHLYRKQNIIFDTNSIYPKIAALWDQNLLNKDLQQRYAYHINIIADSLKNKVTNETLCHHLNLLALQNIPRSEKLVVITEKSRELMSQSTVSLPMTDKKLPWNWRSDSAEFGKDLSYYFECPALCALADSREILQSGFLEGSHLEKHPLSEFEDIELLSASVFQKTLQKCFDDYGYSQMYYFEPTDTVLIFFNQMENSEVVERVESGILPTPLCLFEFCKNAHYKSDRSTQQEYPKIDFKDKERAKSDQRSESEEDLMTLRDENFILPASLKAEVLRKVYQQPMDERKPKIREDKIVSEGGSKRGEKPSKKEESSKGKKEKNSKEKVVKKRILDTPLDTSFLPKREKLVARCAEKGEPFKLIGYDLGERKIEVSSIKKSFFSIDGTNVNVDLETGLDSRKLLRIGITNVGCRLQLHSVIHKGCLCSMFPIHFTTSEGLIVAFEKLHDNNRILNVSYKSRLWNSCFDFRVTWPSGLYIEPVAEYTSGNLFYIQQKYISKGPDLASIAKETHRKYLGNATVAIFLENGTITVLQSNGTIVTCTEFKKLEETKDIDFSKGDTVPTPILAREREDVSSKKSTSELSDEVSFERVASTLETKIQEEIAPYREKTPNIKISGYSVLEPDGRRYEVREGVVVQFNRLLVRTASSYEVDERFTRRADGTDMLLKSNGDFIVSFPDGTRITTGYIIEEEPLICDWTETELEEFQLSDHLKHSTKLNENQALGEENKVLKSNSFVSVLLTSRMEHVHYSTVKYDPVIRSCILSMPGEVDVRISQKGTLDVTVASKVQLNIRENDLTLSTEACSNCNTRTTTFYELRYLDSGNGVDLSKGSVLTTTDMFGNIFRVKYDGTSSYESKKKLFCGCDRGSGGKSCLDEYSSRESEKKEVEVHRQKKGTKSFHSEVLSGGRCRFFAMNRDLTANEYLHRSEKLQHEKKIIADDKSSLIFYQVPGQPDLLYQMSLSPLKPLQKFGLWFEDGLNMDMKNRNREDIFRSTYSNPYDWLFPFGKNGDGTRETHFNKPLKRLDGTQVSEVLEARILRQIKSGNINHLIDTKHAIGSYCQKVINKFNEYHSYSPTDVRNTYEKKLEDTLRNISLGIQKTIEIDTYRRGLLKSYSKEEEKKVSTFNLKRSFDQTVSENQNYEWYRQCMRQMIVIPYFTNITGVCFLWIKECIQKAINLSEVKNVNKF